MLIAYDASGDVLGTLDNLVVYDDDGMVLGLLDFELAEAAGKDLQEILSAPTSVGTGFWPEWLGPETQNFRVVLAGPSGKKRLVRLVHKKSGHERTREAVEAAIAARRARTPEGQPVDLRDILGGPDRPLLLDENGRTRPRPAKSQRPALPVVSLGRG